MWFARYGSGHPSLSPDLDKERANARRSYPVLVAGALAGVCSWVVTFPFDVIKTRVQSTLSTGQENPFRNMWSTIVHSYRQEGFGVFFHGLKPTIIRYVLCANFILVWCSPLSQGDTRKYGHICYLRARRTFVVLAF